ncbi:MAG: hypothetical protein QG635_103 [Bacteroidota bacterium]|nr:hypothetical protein [Bacteroidota bacterium]
MPDETSFRFNPLRGIPRKKSHPAIHIILFAFTVLTTVIAGTAWAFKDYTEAYNWHYGITYSILILTFLSSHEFGHYFAARYHKVDATLPYYIPAPNFIMPFGTFGAVIRTRTAISSKIALFDIGAAGPLAGFIVSVGFLIYGLMTLPGIEYIYNIHPEYLFKYGGKIPKTNLFFGDTALFSILAKYFANPAGFLPPMNEIYHYPFLCVGWFGLFVTSLNLLPIGQLDGGHILYAMFGKRQGIIARFVWWGMIVIGIGSLLNLLILLLQDDSPGRILIFLRNNILPGLNWLKNVVPWYFETWTGWIFWAILTRIVIKLDHPQIGDDKPLGSARTILGWLIIVIIFLCFSYNGIYII